MVVWPHWLWACSEAAYYSGGAHDGAKLLHSPRTRSKEKGEETGIPQFASRACLPPP